jgi:effector-binding domain-containing protein
MITPMRQLLNLVIAFAVSVAATCARCDGADVAPPAPEAAVRIVDQPFTRTLFGKSGRHDPAKAYGDEIIALLDQVWPKVKQPGLKTTGINHIAYGQDDSLFAGVEVTEGDAAAAGLEKRVFTLPRYATYHHVGPYSGLPQAWKLVEAEIARQGLTRAGVALEIYGHWSEDTSKLETDILIPLTPAAK